MNERFRDFEPGVPDEENPEWTKQDFARARPFAEALPEVAASIRRRGKQAMPTKELVSIRLNRDVLEKFRALGPGWQKRINAALEKLAKDLGQEPAGSLRQLGTRESAWHERRSMAVHPPLSPGE